MFQGIRNNIRNMAEDLAIKTLKDMQPTFDCFKFLDDPDSVITTMYAYFDISMKCLCYVQEKAPAKIERHIAKIVICGVSGGALCSLFWTAITSLYISLATASPSGFFTTVCSLILAWGSGYIFIELARDLDARIRYAAIIEGIRDLRASRV